MRIFTTTVAIAVAIAAMAQTQTKVIIENQRPAAFPYENVKLDPRPVSKVPTGPAMKHSSRTLEYDPITEAPEGEAVIYWRNTMEYVFNGLYESIQWVEGNIGKVIYGENDEVYLYEPISGYPSFAYLKGKKEGNQVVFPLPQPLTEIWTYDEDWEDIILDGYAMALGDYKGTGYMCGDVEGTLDLCFDIREDGSLVQPPMEDETYMPIGLCDDQGRWYGYANWAYEYLVYNQEPLQAPEGLVTEPYVLKTEKGAHLTEVGFDGSDIYIHGLSTIMPNAWIKGTVEGDKINLPNAQLLGANETYGFFLFFMGGVYEEVETEDGDSYYSLVYTENIEFTWDAENKEFSSDMVILITQGICRNYVSYVEMYDKATFLYQDPNFEPCAPQNPIVTSFEPYEIDWDYPACVRFTLPKLDVENHILDTEKMAYYIFVDGEPFELEPGEFEVEEPTLLIPYNLNAWPLFASEEYHSIYFYFDLDEFAVQSVYFAPNGKEYRSATVNQDNEAGIGSTITDNEAVSVEYYDMAGRRAMRPENGIYVRITRYADGSFKASKTVRK